MLKVEELSWLIYKSYGIRGVGKIFFSEFLDKIITVNKTDFLSTNLRNFDARYNSELMLCLPELWMDFRLEDWSQLMSKVGDRPSVFKPMEDLGLFGDVQFLCKFLEVDGLKIYIHQESISDENKINLMKYMRMNTYFFVKSEFDYVFIEEEYERGYIACNLQDLDKAKTSLLSTNNLREFPQNEETAHQDIVETINYFEQYLKLKVKPI